MPRAYSRILRDRVIDAALGGLPARQGAAQFRIGLATAIRWVRRARQTGDRTAGRQGQPRRSKLDPHREYILGLLEATPDMTISEMLDKLAAERDAPTTSPQLDMSRISTTAEIREFLLSASADQTLYSDSRPKSLMFHA